MNNAGDAAEQIVRMSLQGVEVAAKISGEGAERLAKILLAALKDTKRTKGRATLSTMLKSKKPIKVFEIKDDDLKKFCQEAKKYGVMYHVLKDRDKKDGKCDIMVRSEDASKINRIFERFNLGANNKATIRAAIEKTKNGEKQAPERKRPEKSKEDKFIDELFSKVPNKEKSSADNPSQAKMEKSRPSEPTYERRSSQRGTRDNNTERPSVRKELQQIKDEKKKSPPNHQKEQTQFKGKKKSKGGKEHGRNR